MKKWTVYQVTNRINGRRYIGVHKTEDPNDSYMGSGKLIKYAIAKHGVENFSKEVLLVTEHKAEAYALEASLVTKDALESGELYNLKEGGEGGWDFCNSTLSSELKSKFGKLGGKLGATARNLRISQGIIPHHFLGKTHSEETRRKMSESQSRRSHSEETRRKMSEGRKITSAGSRNSQFGTCWITNGIKSSKIKKSDPIPMGWSRGRI